MIYTVVWTKQAMDLLAHVWNGATDRQAVTDASDEVDRALRRDAHLRGESRENGDRILFEPPLGVHFRVSEPDRIATVFYVWAVNS
jgi:hypothetical protein